jgi:hypothetical protein
MEDRFEGGKLWRLRNGHRRQDRYRDKPRVSKWRQLGEPDPVRKPIRQSGRYLQREAALPNAARAREREQMAGGEKLCNGGDIHLATDEAREVSWQVMVNLVVATVWPDTAPSAHGHDNAQETGTLGGRQLESVRQALSRIAIRVGRAPFELLDSVDAQASSLGQYLLGPP